MKSYQGCLTPNCKKRVWTRGLCHGCHQAAVRKLKELPSEESHTLEAELVALGVLLPTTRRGTHRHHGYAMSIHAPFASWLPDISKSTVKIDRASVKCCEHEDLDLSCVPAEVAAKFDKMTKDDVRELANNPTKWSPGTYEKQIVLQARMNLWVAFGSRGIHHPEDRKTQGVGTPVPVRTVVSRDYSEWLQEAECVA